MYIQHAGETLIFLNNGRSKMIMFFTNVRTKFLCNLGWAYFSVLVIAVSLIFDSPFSIWIWVLRIDDGCYNGLGIALSDR